MQQRSALIPPCAPEPVPSTQPGSGKWAATSPARAAATAAAATRSGSWVRSTAICCRATTLPCATVASVAIPPGSANLENRKVEASTMNLDLARLPDRPVRVQVHDLIAILVIPRTRSHRPQCHPRIEHGLQVLAADHPKVTTVDQRK